jgi:hypothetical protein
MAWPKFSHALCNLSEAASLSAALTQALAHYANATTREQQHTQLDGLLGAWANTSGFAPTLDDRDPTHFRIRYLTFGAVTREANLLGADWNLSDGNDGGGGETTR